MSTVNLKSKRLYASAGVLLALISILVASSLADAGQGFAAEQAGAPIETNPMQDDGNPRMNFGVCRGEVHDPHNSSRDPKEDYVQAKTDIYCDDPLNGSTLTVTQNLCVRNAETGHWAYMQSNTSVCPAGTATTAWVNCWNNNYGRHRIMESSVNALCEIGSTKDYVQTSRATLTKPDGSTYSGGAYKIRNNVYCKGEGN